MWEGKWSKELNGLYEAYFCIFNKEPDCENEIDFDTVSYTEYVQLLKKCVLFRKPFEDIYPHLH